MREHALVAAEWRHKTARGQLHRPDRFQRALGELHVERGKRLVHRGRKAEKRQVAKKHADSGDCGAWRAQNRRWGNDSWRRAALAGRLGTAIVPVTAIVAGV
jgi:hypothetical protein